MKGLQQSFIEVKITSNVRYMYLEGEFCFAMLPQKFIHASLPLKNFSECVTIRLKGSEPQ